MMMRAAWYFDFISPFAYLQLGQIKDLSKAIEIEFRPILLAGLLDHHGQRGPAEIPSKRRFTYRYTQWRAQQAGILFKYPPAHPFNPLTALRLVVAAGSSEAAITAIFEHIWLHGHRGDDAESLEPVARALRIASIGDAVSQAWVKDQLKANFDSAIAEGIFGVPTILLEGHIFWGDDATGMIRAYLEDRALFDSQEMRRLATLPVGTHRKAAR